MYEAYGQYLFSMNRLDEALAESREAARLDPLSVSPFHDIGINALLRRNYDAAAADFRRTIDIDPNWTWGYIKLGRALGLAGKCKEAFEQTEISEHRIANSQSPLSRTWLASTYASCGDDSRARQKLSELHAIAEKRYVDPAAFAAIHASLGEMDEAMRLYQKGLDERSPDMVHALIMPTIIPQLAGSKEYQALVGKMGFPATDR